MDLGIKGKRALVLASSQGLNELVPQVTPPAVVLGEGAGMGLVHDHEVRAGAYEFVPSPGRLDIVGGDNDKGVELK